MIKKLIIFISLFFLTSPHVFADTVNRYYIQDTSSTKSTYWYAKGSNSSWTYENQYIVYNNTNERYVTFSSCLTGSLIMSISSNLQGSISFLDYYTGDSCSVQGYNGSMYYYVFYVNSFYDPQAQGEYYNYFNLYIDNLENYRVYQDIFDVYTTSYNPLDQNNTNEKLDDINDNIGNINDNINNTNEKLDDLNDNITNDNVSGVEESFAQFEDFLDDNSTITQLITLPVTLYSSIIQGISNSCTPFNLGSLYGESLILPCINIGNYLGSTLWGMIDLIISGFAIYSISKKLIKVFNNFSSMKDGDVIDD